MANQKISARTILTSTGLVSRPAARAGSTTDYRTVDNLIATTDPGATDDSADGFHIGSQWFNSSTFKLWVCSDATATAAVWRQQMDAAKNLSDLASAATARNNIGASPKRHKGYVSGRFYFVPEIVPAAGAPVVVNTMYLFPFIPPSDVTISELYARVSTAQAAKLFSLAIYGANETTVRPSGNALGALAANGSMASTGIVGGALASNAALTAGTLYWLAFNSDTTTGAMSSISLASPWIAGLIGSATAAAADLWNGGAAATIQGLKIASQTFSGTPYVWPDVTAATFVVVANDVMPNIAFKAA
jgi:hypothetical protein